MKSQIAVEQALTPSRRCRSPHSVHRRLQGREIRPCRGRESCCQAFDGTAQFVELSHSSFTQVDDSRTSTRLLRDEPVLRQNVDRFADGALGYAKFRCPFALDDSLSRAE